MTVAAALIVAVVIACGYRWVRHAFRDIACNVDRLNPTRTNQGEQP